MWWKWECERFTMLLSLQSTTANRENQKDRGFSTLQGYRRLRIRDQDPRVARHCHCYHVTTTDFMIKPPRKSRPGSGHPRDPGLQQYRRRTGQGSRWNLGRRCYKPIVSRCLAVWAKVQRTGNDRCRFQGESPRGSGRSGSRGQRVRRRLQARLLW